VAVLRATLLALGLLLLAAGTGGGAWGALWLAIPAVVTASLLLAWRFGVASLALPALLAALPAVALLAPGALPLRPWTALWLPAAAATGAWMGLREEGGGPGLGARAWMHVPLLVAAALLPALPGFTDGIARAEARARAGQQEALATLRDAGAPASVIKLFQQSAQMPAAQQIEGMRYLLPNMMFLWMVALVAAGRSFAARGAALLGWPPLSRAALHLWRLPDPALLPLLAGLALALFGGAAWKPGAAALLVQSALGYSVQGLAVVMTVLASRGVPATLVVLLLVFLVAFTLPVFLPAVALVGLGDVWLDFRRLEPSPHGEA